MNLEQIKSITIYVLGLAAVIIGAIPAVSEPVAVHTALVAVGAVIVALERYLQGQVEIVGRVRK
jgi:uncharacterized membrane-anchored protein